MNISITNLITILKQQIEVHEQLLRLSREKTPYIKESDSESLVKLLTNERRLIERIEQLENEREQVVATFFAEHNVHPEAYTLSELLALIKDAKEKEKLERLTVVLLELIVGLKETEQLNQSLLQQSIQFVHLSLDLLQPESKNIHYGDHIKRKQKSQSRSIFDSKI